MAEITLDEMATRTTGRKNQEQRRKEQKKENERYSNGTQFDSQSTK